MQAVRAYDATPEWLSKAIGYGLPVLEIAWACCWWWASRCGSRPRSSALLFVVFLIGVVQAVARGDCSWSAAASAAAG